MKLNVSGKRAFDREGKGKYQVEVPSDAVMSGVLRSFIISNADAMGIKLGDLSEKVAG